MNAIKEIRQQLGYTQEELVKESGLSLRTIQRSEADEHPPKGHSLKMLAKAFDLTPVELQERFAREASTDEREVLRVKLINLSVLTFYLCPFGNIIFPFYLWRKYRSSSLVEAMGRRIVNFQIFWTVTMISSLIVAPFTNDFFFPSHNLVLYVLFLFLALNVGVVLATARSIQREEMSFPKPPVALL